MTQSNHKIHLFESDDENWILIKGQYRLAQMAHWKFLPQREVVRIPPEFFVWNLFPLICDFESLQKCDGIWTRLNKLKI